jgi:CheY-like chemotaxis protein
MIVDHDVKTVRLLRVSIEQAQCRVPFANDGEPALHILRRQRPDLAGRRIE